MNYGRQKRLVERLLEKSRAGELDWQESAGSDQLQFSFSKCIAQIFLAISRENSTYQIKLIDYYGRIAEFFSNVELGNDNEHQPRIWRDVMREVFELARRRVLTADEALDGRLAEMN